MSSSKPVINDPLDLLDNDKERVRRQVVSTIAADGGELKRARLTIRQLKARITALEEANNELYAESSSLKTIIARLSRSSTSRDETIRKLASELLVSKGVPLQDWYEGRGSSGGRSSSSPRVTDPQWYNLG
jgi:chromosome segregation ATPase